MEPPALPASVLLPCLPLRPLQLGAGYGLSQRADKTVAAAHDMMRVLMNADEHGEVRKQPAHRTVWQGRVGPFRRAPITFRYATAGCKPGVPAILN